MRLEFNLWPAFAGFRDLAPSFVDFVKSESSFFYMIDTIQIHTMRITNNNLEGILIDSPLPKFSEWPSLSQGEHRVMFVAP